MFKITKAITSDFKNTVGELTFIRNLNSFPTATIKENSIHHIVWKNISWLCLCLMSTPFKLELRCNNTHPLSKQFLFVLFKYFCRPKHFVEF